MFRVGLCCNNHKTRELDPRNHISNLAAQLASVSIEKYDDGVIVFRVGLCCKQSPRWDPKQSHFPPCFNSTLSGFDE